jgi:galactonate dehydratase
MKRRAFLASPALLAAAPDTRPLGATAFDGVGSKLRVTGLKVFGVSLNEQSDRPYVFVKLETNEGLIGWGEATLEGKASAVMACVADFRDLLIGADPMQVEHHWQSMYVHSFYRAGPVIGSAISGIDQALWDLRGKAMGLPVHELLGGATDPRGVRGYYHARAATRKELEALRETAQRDGVTCFKTGIPGYWEWIDSRSRVREAIGRMRMLREALGPAIDIGVDFHAKTSPAVATALIRGVDDLNFLFIEEPCPPENVEAMRKIAARVKTPIATGERLISHYQVREVVEKRVAKIMQTDINHVGGITALRKVAMICGLFEAKLAPHACEGPIGGLATLHVDAASPNFLVQEICSGVTPGPAEKIWEEWLGFPAMRMVDGRFPLPTKPGLGFDLTEDALRKFPFRGTRPMARVFHPDGSVAAW